MNTTEARELADNVRARLRPPGTRARRNDVHLLLSLVRRLADALDEARAELRRRDDLTTPYERLVEDWNALVGGLRDLGLVVTSLDWERWIWAYRGRSGSAATSAEAFLAALRDAGIGVETAPPPRALDPPRLCDHCGLPLVNGSIVDEVIITNDHQHRTMHRVCADHLIGQGWFVVARARGATSREQS